MVPTNPYVVFHVLLFLFITVQSYSDCNRSCGDQVQVPYPFGFSESCEIRLNCTKGLTTIGEFQAKVTTESILVTLPGKCNRSIAALTSLFGKNYGLTWRNGLLLQNCTSPPRDCVIPRALLKYQLKGISDCDEPYCFSKERSDDDRGYMAYTDVENSSCKFLVSSVAVNAWRRNISLMFETVQLGWWLEGGCNCSNNANCTQFLSPVTGKPVFRCRCGLGYKGDGFMAGNGCRKESSRCDVTKYLGGQCGGNTRIGVLVGGIIAGACLVTGLTFLSYLIRKRSIASKSKEITKKLLSEALITVPFYSYKEIERATYCFSDKCRLGNGAYGTVYAGKLQNDELVAIKKIRHRDNDGIESTMNEIKLISSVSHPNLVHLLGFCLEKNEQILVYEFMPNGTLSQHLQREIGTGLPWTIRLNIATETAHAIAYLHSMDPPIYHRDIKSSNILLDSNFTSKVADFGLSRIGLPESSHISTAPQGTPGYLDPQYHQNFHLSDKSDVYSFGVVLVEIMTAKKVVDFSRRQTEVNLAALAIEKIGKGHLDEIIDPSLEPGKDAWTVSSIHKMAELAFRCLAFHRDMRPSMMEAAAELEQIKLSGWAPLEENNCVPLSLTSCYSSPSNRSEMSQRSIVKNETVKKLVITEVQKDWSPVSINEPWLSQESSPSTNSFLDSGTR